MIYGSPRRMGGTHASPRHGTVPPASPRGQAGAAAAAREAGRTASPPRGRTGTAADHAQLTSSAQPRCSLPACQLQGACLTLLFSHTASHADGSTAHAWVSWVSLLVAICYKPHGRVSRCLTLHHAGAVTQRQDRGSRASGTVHPDARQPREARCEPYFSPSLPLWLFSIAFAGASGFFARKWAHKLGWEPGRLGIESSCSKLCIASGCKAVLLSSAKVQSSVCWRPGYGTHGSMAQGLSVE